MKSNYIKLDIFVLALFIIVLIVALQNTGVVTINVLFWKISMSRVILIPFILFIGFLMGLIVGKNKK
jgi:lipopolysaccharide assembly protein A